MFDGFKKLVSDLNSKADAFASNDPNSIYYDYTVAAVSCYYYKIKNLLTK